MTKRLQLRWAAATLQPAFDKNYFHDDKNDFCDDKNYFRPLTEILSLMTITIVEGIININIVVVMEKERSWRGAERSSIVVVDVKEM